jgi:hypothetical protein
MIKPCDNCNTAIIQKMVYGEANCFTYCEAFLRWQKQHMNETFKNLREQKVNKC